MVRVDSKIVVDGACPHGPLSSPTVWTPQPGTTWSPVVEAWRPSTGPAPIQPRREEEMIVFLKRDLMVVPSQQERTQHVMRTHVPFPTTSSGPNGPKVLHQS